MTALVLENKWNPTINQVEVGEEISAGPDGNANIATRQLAENVFFLKAENAAMKAQIEAILVQIGT